MMIRPGEKTSAVIGVNLTGSLPEELNGKGDGGPILNLLKKR
jgi:hypothetical protein